MGKEANRALNGEVDLFREADGTLVARLTGSWTLASRHPGSAGVLKALNSDPPPRRLRVDMAAISEWDTSLLPVLTAWEAACRKASIDYSRGNLAPGVCRLLSLSEAVPEKEGTGRGGASAGFFARVGLSTIALTVAAREIFSFLGEAVLVFGRLITGRARFRRQDFWLTVQQVGADALPIITLISFLVGLIMAFVGAVQLQQFGATIYVANLVGLAMVREMGAMMTGIIMAGRTGAAFAAQLGSMKVSEELDALRTMGVSPMEFLVLPRMLALFLMMPLLCLYANFVGILGGLTVSVAMLDLSLISYVRQTTSAIDLGSFSAGLIKSTVFGILVAATGCLRGMQCGNSSAAVGVAATSAVVSGITCIIIADALFAIIFQVIGL